jgi:hypothetical protein
MEGVFSIFQRELVCRCAITAPLGFGNVHLGGFTSIRGSERSTDEMFTSKRGERRWPMPRLLNNPDRDFLASQSEDDINAEIAEFFASRPLGIAELFADPIVQMRIGSLITEAINEAAAQSQDQSWQLGRGDASRR